LSNRSALCLVIASLAGLHAAPFVGAQICATCHEETHREWSLARHGKMIQPATAASIEGDFSHRPVLLRGVSYRFRMSLGGFYITESRPSGKPREYRVDYTLGSRRVQHYLTKLPDGRLVVLAPSWDVQRKQWFHNMEIVDPEESAPEVVQVWNKNCYSCHVSREQKNYDLERNTYDTKWQDFGTNCERCHGAGEEHVARYQQPKPSGPDSIVVPSKLTPVRSTMVCAQCHSARDIVAEGFTAGSNYFDFFLPILEYGQKQDHDPSYWPDGRTRRFSNDALGLWQSQCYLKGFVTCTQCHNNVHDPEIEKNAAVRPGANAICTGCHASIAEDVPGHTHHAANSVGSACVECHMPRTVFSVKAAIRDHSISVPVPENTIAYNIPNACNVCHQDRDAKWSLVRMTEWFGNRSRQKLIRRAQAFSSARAGDRKAIEPLLAILAEPSEGPVARANALGHISRFRDDPRVQPAIEGALSDAEPLLRAVAAQHVESQQGIPSLTRALADPLRSVRAGAALSLVNLGVPKLEGQDGERFEVAKKEYLARSQIQSDDAGEQKDAGTFLLLAGDPQGAIKAFEASLKIEPKQSLGYPLGLAYLRAGRKADGVRALQGVSREDSFYQAAKVLLETLTK
jgi:Cytochrome c552/Cytochrome c554 and c-prime